MLGQSNAILRLLGMKHGYYPTDPMEAYKCDSLIDGYMDVLGKIYKPHFKADGPEKDEAIKEIFEKLIPGFVS